MGHFEGSENRSFYVEDDGTYWDSPAKKHQYDPKTFELLEDLTAEVLKKEIPILQKLQEEEEEISKEIDEEIGELDKEFDFEELHADRIKELDKMQWGKLRALHKHVTGRDERKMKKKAIILDIIRQEIS